MYSCMHVHKQNPEIIIKCGDKILLWSDPGWKKIC